MLATSQIRRGTFYALKILQDGNNESKREAFETERAYLSAFDHPSIMKIVDQGRFTAGATDYVEDVRGERHLFYHPAHDGPDTFVAELLSKGIAPALEVGKSRLAATRSGRCGQSRLC